MNKVYFVIFCTVSFILNAQKKEFDRAGKIIKELHSPLVQVCNLYQKQKQFVTAINNGQVSDLN